MYSYGVLWDVVSDELECTWSHVQRREGGRRHVYRENNMATMVGGGGGGDIKT